MSNESSNVGFLGAVGAGLVALLGGIGRLADDFVRVGAGGAARVGAGAAGGIDDAARMGTALGGSADDLARGAGATRSGGTTKFAAEALQQAGNLPLGGDDPSFPRKRLTPQALHAAMEAAKKSRPIPSHGTPETRPWFPVGLPGSQTRGLGVP